MKQEIEMIYRFLQSTFTSSGKKRVVIAVSGGIDSAVSCTLLTQALGVESVFPVLLPYGDQSYEDSIALLGWLQIPERNRRVINIEPAVEELKKTAGLGSRNRDQVHDDRVAESVQHDCEEVSNKIRLGNLMARTRMTLLYDLAKQLEALVCGTENKSEKYLGYFTRFGDEASDIEPIQHLYKTQIYELARELHLPTQFLEKSPSAGLWPNQTDEAELGFTYQDADFVLQVLVDEQPKLLKRLIESRSTIDFTNKNKALEQIGVEVVSILDEKGQRVALSVVLRILMRVKDNWFKHEVPHRI